MTSGHRVITALTYIGESAIITTIQKQRPAIDRPHKRAGVNLNGNKQRATATIHLSALRKNFEYIKALTGGTCKICAMVKADAYGHGAVGVAVELARCGADYLGLADIYEARTLREAGIKTPILMMGYTPKCDMPRLREYGLAQTVFDLDYAEMLNDAVDGKVRCHLKLDTGMGRLGYVCPDGFPTKEILRTLELPNLDFEGVYTHFAKADDTASDLTRRQFENFTAVLANLAYAGHKFQIRHAANSAAIMNFPDMHLDMVRPGIMLFGLMPDGGKNEHLVPVLDYAGAVELVKTVSAGTTISYGGTYRCETDKRIAVVSLGYADGVSRTLSNRGFLLVNGKRAQILGRVCMDHLMIDAEKLGKIECGTPAYIIGGGAKGNTADELAELEGTIGYEVLCRMVGSRVKKIYTE